MAGQQRESAEDRAIREIDAEDEQAIQALAAQAGPPPDARRLSEADEDEAWETADPNVDHEELARLLLTEGLPPEVVNGLLVAKLRPDWVPLYGRPTQDAERAHMLARLAQFPFRLSLIEDIDDPDERTAKAEALDRRYRKRLTANQEREAGLGAYGRGRGEG
jgi:hypothetical protein